MEQQGKAVGKLGEVGSYRKLVREREQLGEAEQLLLAQLMSYNSRTSKASEEVHEGDTGPSPQTHLQWMKSKCHVLPPRQHLCGSLLNGLALLW